MKRRRRKDDDLDAEIRAHLDEAIRDRIARGEAPNEARANALREFGNVGLVKEVTREMWGWGWLEALGQDLRFGLRMLRGNPGFSLVAILTLALGIGANTAIFSVVNALLLRSLPYAESERLALLSETSPAGERLSASHPNFADWRTRAQSFEGMAASYARGATLTGAAKAERLRARVSNWSFFSLLGVRPQLGRFFLESEDRYGAPRTVVLSHGFWTRFYGAQAGAIGRTLTLNGETHTVIGVLPPGFEYFEAADVHLPLGLSLSPDSPFAGRGNTGGAFYAVARLKPGVTLSQANSEVAAIGRQLAREYPLFNEGKGAQAERLQDVMAEGVRNTLWVLLGAVGFILLIACINVANLLLVRGAERQKELAVRQALGAGRMRLIRQLLSETLLISTLGAAGGLLLGRWMLAGLLRLAPSEIPQLNRIGLDSGVLLFTLGLAAATSLLCGLLPAWQASKTDVQIALKAGGGRTTGAARDGLRGALLIAEVGLSLVLLAGAGLLVRSMWNLLHVDPGFNTDNLLTMRLVLSGDKYNARTARAFYDECLARVNAVPGVRAAALTISVPIQGSNWGSVFTVAGQPAASNADLPHSEYIRVSANYFETMGIRLLRGRGFTAADTPESAPVAVVNETLARRIWPGEDPIGKRIKQGFPDSDEPWREVVGVVNDIKMNGVEHPAAASQTYLLFSQDPGDSVGVVVRAAAPPLTLAPAIEQAIHAIDRDLPVYSIWTMDQLLGNSLAQRRLTLVLLGSFAALALLLAAIGIYGVISYAVRRRTHELGIRMALGAQTRDLLGMILAQGMKLASIGIVLGLAAAFGLTRWMESLLFGVRPTDPLTFGGIALALLLVALLACWLPARRAMKLDPLIALRRE